MIIYSIVLAAATALAYYVHKPETLPSNGITRQQLVNRICLCGIFLMLFSVSALRYQVGNDYSRYEEYFYNIWYGFVVPTERGFNAMVKLLEYLFGRECYLLIFAFFAFATVYFTLKALYLLGKNFVFSFFLFMAFGYYYQSLNTVRYYFAVALAMYAVTYLFRRQYMKFILLILLAASFHKSVLLVIPIYLLANCRWRLWQVILLTAVSASTFLLKDVYLRMVLYLYPTYRDTIYLEGGASYINIARCLLIMLLCLILRKENWAKEKQMLFYCRLNIGAFLLYTCGTFLPEVSRIGTYMTVMQVFLLPGMVDSITDKRKKKWIGAGIILFGLLYYAAFLYKAQGMYVKLLPYRTWLFGVCDQ